MESLLVQSQVGPLSTPKLPESRKLKFLRLLNLVFLIIFCGVWSLNFIWVGWAGLYAIIMAFAFVCTILNILFQIASHTQRMRPFQLWHKVMIAVYVVQAISVILSATFFVLGCIEMEHFSNHSGRLNPDDQQKYLISKWMLIFSSIFAALTFSFTSYLREFQYHYIEEPNAEEKGGNEDDSDDLSDDEENAGENEQGKQ